MFVWTYQNRFGLFSGMSIVAFQILFWKFCFRNLFQFQTQLTQELEEKWKWRSFFNRLKLIHEERGLNQDMAIEKNP